MRKETSFHIILSSVMFCAAVRAGAADAPARPEPPPDREPYGPMYSLPPSSKSGTPLTSEEQADIVRRYDADVKRLVEALGEHDSAGNPTASSHRAALALEHMRRPEALPFIVRYITYGSDYGSDVIFGPIVERHRYLQWIVENHGEAGVQMILRQLGNRDEQGITWKELYFYAYAIRSLDGFNEEGKKRSNTRLDKVEQKEGAKPVFKRLRQAIADRNSPLGP